MISFKFNDYDFSKLVVVETLSMPFLSKEAALTSVGRADGSLFNYSRHLANKIELGCHLVSDLSRTNVAHTRDAILAQLDTDAPARLVFSNDPSRYFSAIFDGDQTYEARYANFTDITLTFTVPDGLAHAVTPKTFTSPTDTTVVKNVGTAKAWPVLEAQMQSDNGFVGFINPNTGGVLQFGKLEEVDKIPAPSSDKAIAFSMETKPAGATENTGFMQYAYNLNDTSTPNKFDGAMVYGNLSGDKNSASPGFIAQDWGACWLGPSLHADIVGNYDDDQTGSFNFSNRYRIPTVTTRMFRIETTLESAGDGVMTCILRSSTIKKNDAWMDMYVNGRQVKSVSINLKKLPLDFCELEMQRRGDTATFILNTVKSGTTLQIGGMSVKYSFSIEDFGQVPIDAMTVWFSGYRSVDYFPMGVFWSNCSFTWINAAADIDIPNTFSAGDVLTVDTGTHSVLLNGAPSSLFTIGNQWDKFGITEPETDIQTVVSDWAAQPVTIITLEEAFD
ncbi:distal tail protein Dit [Lacticaseibacillus mingshuiensis]|uniref:distal tail protein Dit n=1 Tax=Lacticaseibacillus mingshuiensis TaxID=2799574 RepID=UPI00194EB7F8|nr:distal tail protein Dit [Lacticaseibacillus mingshuiensis]